MYKGEPSLSFEKQVSPPTELIRLQAQWFLQVNLKQYAKKEMTEKNNF